MLLKHSSTGTLLLMNIDIHDITHVNCDWFSLCGRHMCYIESSDDGQARGFWQLSVLRGASLNPGTDCPTTRFTIDSSQDRCAAALGHILLPQWRQIKDPPLSRDTSFDNVRGRLCRC